MSKAFTKDDAEPDVVNEANPADLVPVGAVNYLTVAGLNRFQDELRSLNDSPPGDDARERRRRYLTRLIEISRPFAPPAQPGAVVRFGATVRVLDADAVEREYVVVGIHEADPAAGRISWNSPLARALLGRARGDEVTLRRPDGEDELEILGVEFKPLT